MQYEIPQELEYREKIVFNLDFEQLIYASLAAFLSLLILKSPVSLTVKLTIILIFASIASLFMWFNFKATLRNFLRWVSFRHVHLMSSKMNNFFSLHNIEGNSFEIKTKGGKILRAISKDFYAVEKIAILKIMPINFSIRDEDSKLLIIKNFQSFLNSLDFNIQIIIKTEPLVLDDYFNSLEKGINQKYISYFNEHKENLIGLIQKEKIQNRNFYIVIKGSSSIETKVSLCLEKLKLMHLQAVRLDEKDLLKFLKCFFKNAEDKSYVNDVSRMDYLNYLVSPNYIKNNISFLEIDNKFCTSLIAFNYPRNVQAGFLDRLIKLNGDFDISLHIEPFPIEETIVKVNKELQKQRSDLYSLKKRKILNTSLEIKYQDTRKILEELQKGSQKLFNLSMHILIRADSRQELDVLLKKTETELNSLLISHKIPLFNVHNSLKSVMPFCFDNLNFKRNITTEALSAFFPFSVKFLDIDNNGVLLGFNNNNIPIIKDIFNLGNSNGFVLASSGYGKSFYAKLFLIRQLMLNTKVFVIDPQNEYSNLGRQFNAQVINIDKSARSMINVMDLLGQDYVEKRLSLMDLMQLMLGNLTDIQKAVLDKALTNCYLKKGISTNKKTWKNKAPKLEDLKKELVSLMNHSGLKEKPTYLSIVNRLSLYVNGVFSFMNKHTSINIENDFIIFNIGSIPKQLKPVIMFLVLDYIYIKMRSSLERKLLVIDEAWTLLNKAEDASYVFEIVKTSRKFNLALLLITQDAIDLTDSKAGSAILSNSSYTVLFSHKPAAIDSIAKILRLSPYEKDFLLTSSIGNGLILLGNEHSELKVIASDKEYSLVTTNPNDFLNNLSKNYRPVKESNFKKIDLDLERRFFIKGRLRKEEIEYLLNNNYVISCQKDIFNNVKQEYLLKPFFNEGTTHFFLVFTIAGYIKKFTKQVYCYNTVKPDIVFKAKDKSIAIEVETGCNISKPDFSRKVDFLNKNYDEWFFVLTEPRLLEKYKKYGVCLLRNEIRGRIDDFFKSQKIGKI
ncbi:MAG: ATP-binding protein [Nanoarchaeota archaeon]